MFLYYIVGNQYTRTPEIHLFCPLNRSLLKEVAIFFKNSVKNLILPVHFENCFLVSLTFLCALQWVLRVGFWNLIVTCAGNFVSGDVIEQIVADCYKCATYHNSFFLNSSEICISK